MVLLGERQERSTLAAVLAGRRPVRTLVFRVVLDGYPCQRGVAHVRASRRLMITAVEVSAQLRHGAVPRTALAAVGTPDFKLQNLLLDGLVKDGRQFRVATVWTWAIFGLVLLGNLPGNVRSTAESQVWLQ